MSVIQQSDELQDACGADPSLICEWAYEATGSEGWARTTEVLLARPAKIVLIVLVAVVVTLLVRRAIQRFTARIADPVSQDRLRNIKRKAPTSVVETGVLSLRSAARAQTLALVLRSIASAAIWTIAVAMILGELGIYLGPLLAGAGIAGVAIGFGAQSLVRDFLSGIFMLIEDQYGVGDIIDAGEATGVVEAVSLRTTRLRDVTGTVWYIPNGEIQRVGNMSQQWARALLDVSVAYGSDIDEAQAVIKQVADDLWRSPGWVGKILEEPEVWGVEELGPDAVVIRLVVKTQPSEQFNVMRALRRRLSDALDHAGIEIPFPQRSVWVRRPEGASREANGSTEDGAELDDAADAVDLAAPPSDAGG